MKSYPAEVLCISLFLSGALVGQSYSVTDLGVGVANDINNSGEVVGDSGGSSFLWDGSTRTTLGGFPSRSTTRAVAINDSGYIAASVALGDFDMRGYLLHAGTNMPVNVPYPTGVDHAGNILGYYNIAYTGLPGSPPTRGYHLEPKEPLSRFYSINSHGVIAGSAAEASEDTFGATADSLRACYFTNSTVVYIDTRPVPAVRQPWDVADMAQFRMSEALAINDSGKVAGWFRSEDQGPTHAFYYAGSGMVDLGTLGGSNSVARAINSSSVAVGESELADGSTHAFIYSGGVMQDLNTAAPVAGWEFLTANAINNAGSIVGQGRNQGQLKAYILSPSSATPPPLIIQQPLGIRIAENEPWQLSATVTGPAPVTYQWQLNSTNIPGATNLSFQIASVTPATAGPYRIVATNPGGSAVSSNAVVEILSVTNYYQVADLGPGIANDVNSSGQVVGTAGSLGFFYDGAAVIPLTNVLFGSFTNPSTGQLEETRGDVQAALAINDAGQIATPYFGLNTSGGIVANGLLWSSTYQVTSIDYYGFATGWFYVAGFPSGGIGRSRLGEGQSFSRYFDINRHDVIAGTAGLHAPGFRDFRDQRGRACIVSNGIVTFIDPRPLPEQYIDSNLNDIEENHLSDAFGINDAGTVVGVMSLSLSGPRHAFRYAGSGLEDLGTLGGTNSVARRINTDDVIVGESLTADGKTHAFIYRNGAMTDLNSLLPPDSDLELISATAINDRGQIVGQAVSGGQLRAYLLSPPGLVNAPGISTPPVGDRLGFGASLTLSVTATGTIPFTYQWMLNGTNIANATNSTYVISSASAADLGDYRVLVTNAGGTTPSIAVRVDVLDPGLTAVTYVGLDIVGAIGATYRIEFKPSAGASAWTSVTNLTLTSSPQAWIDLNSRNHPSRIYRATRIP